MVAQPRTTVREYDPTFNQRCLTFSSRRLVFAEMEKTDLINKKGWMQFRQRRFVPRFKITSICSRALSTSSHVLLSV